VTIRFAGIEAVSWEALTKLVETVVPFHSTVDPLVKLDPFTISVNATPPAVTALGRSAEIIGGAGLIVNMMAFEALVPGFSTVMLTVPAEMMRLAGIDAVN
jgi:hypothetical protein